jgi:predicted O-methyltransferase YrrM
MPRRQAETGAGSPAAPEARFEDALERIAGVEGWLTEGQARRLWDAARRAGAGALIVEIGSFRGRSAIVLALAAGPEAEVVAIDPHLGSDRGPGEIAGRREDGEGDLRALRANLGRAGVAGRVRHLRRRSQEALDEVEGDAAVVYVDGAHRYGPARQDIDRWGARVAPGGTLLVHDAFSSVGVTLAIARLLILARSFRYLGRERSLAEYRREDVRGAARARNAARQVTQLGWFARNLAIKLALTLRLRRLARALGSAEWPY